MYSKTHWRDRVVDSETGEVIQEGTFMSAEHFNNMENGIAANDAAISGINNNIDTIETTLETEVGTTIGLTINQSTFVMKFTLKNSEGTVLSEQEVDLPIEGMIINAEYAADSKSLILTLQSGSTVTVPLSALINGLVNESRKVAGIDLKDDITVPELESALEVDKLKTNVDKIANHINGNLTDSDFSEDAEAVMTKTIPAGMGDYAAVKSIGGYTRKTVNLFDINSAPYITKVDDETFNMANHTNVVMTGFKADTRYTFSGYAKNNVSGGNVRFRIRYTDGSYEDIIKVDGSEYTYRQVTSQAGKSISDMIGYYGASGNATFKQFQVQEGTTATAYEPYGELWNAPVESVVSCGRNKCKMIRGITVDPNHGAEVSKEGNSSSPYIKIDLTKEDVYFLRNTGNGINSYVVYFDASKNFIGRSNAWTGEIILKGAYKMNNNGGNVINPDNYMTDIKYIRVVYYSEVLTNSNLAIISTDLGAGKPAYIPFFETTLLMPDALKSLPDWGCAASDTVYNWYDSENKVYHHKVKQYDLGNKVWSPNSTGSKLFFADAPSDSKVNGAGIYPLGNCIAGTTPTKPWELRTHDDTYNKFYIYADSTYTDEEINKKLKGVMLNYELATEELIYVSDMLHPIRCEAGGTIMFSNEHNLDMPNTVVYKKEVSLS